jgi:diadenosine tetraphosphate (Ap4A) HIT family hydrolase
VASLVLTPETVVRPGAVWTVAVNLNQDLLGKTMLVLGRPATAVTDLSSGEWAQLHVELRDLMPALGRLFSPDQVNLAFLMNQDAPGPPPRHPPLPLPADLGRPGLHRCPLGQRLRP